MTDKIQETKEQKNARERAEQGAMNAMNKMFDKYFEPAEPVKYKWYVKNGSRYFYTSNKVEHPKTGKPKYLSGIYRYIKSRNGWKLIKSSVVGFAKRKLAIERTRKMYEEER